MNKKIMLVATLVIICGAALMLTLIKKSSSAMQIIVSVNNFDTSYDVVLEKNNKKIGTFTDKLISVSVNSSEDVLRFSSSNRTDYLLNVSEFIKNKKVAVVTFVNESNATNTFLKESGIDSSNSVFGVRYFADETWMVGFDSLTENAPEGNVTVLKKEGDKWIIVANGTAVDDALLVAVGAPIDLINYVKGL